MKHIRFSVATLVLLRGSRVLACPLCTSDTGSRVRDGIFDSTFGDTLLAMVLPFLVITAVVGLIYNGPPWGSRSHARSSDARPGSPDPGEPHRRT